MSSEKFLLPDDDDEDEDDDDDLLDELEALVILTVNFLLTAALLASSTLSVNVNVPVFVGVPQRAATLSENVSLSPVGRVPLDCVHV